MRQAVKNQDMTRRRFLRSVGAGVPTLALLNRVSYPGDQLSDGQLPQSSSPKFTPIDLARYFNASPHEFGPRARAKAIGGNCARDGVIRMPAGKQIFQGVPFWLGPKGIQRKSWVGLSTAQNAWAQRSVDIPVEEKASFICVAAFCNWDKNEIPAPGENVTEKVGELLGRVNLIYKDGSKTSFPLRRRFEVDAPRMDVEYRSNFNSLPDRKWGAVDLNAPLPSAMVWGAVQTGLNAGGMEPTVPGLGTLWISALSNPEPGRALKSLELEAMSEDPVFVCGLTLFHGTVNPLRHRRLSLYRLTLPEPTAQEKGRWIVDVDLGIVARTFALPDFEPERWLGATDIGLGKRAEPPRASRYLYVEIAASPDATLVLKDTKTGQQHAFDVSGVVLGRELEGKHEGPLVEILEAEKVWLHAEVIDAGTRHPTPVRLSFRSPEGRYIPPCGHRAQVNPAWFQDYGADLQLGEASFAYVDGTFQVELPVGKVYLEMTKGFEYEAVRQKLKIDRGQRELRLEISRIEDFRSRGWTTADTHVHFLSPSTAILEGQAEGLNLINLLASQWGDLFTNVGDLNHGPITSRDGETLVRVGTENRQHLLGHISLLGAKGPPPYHLCASGPVESYIGDPVWSSLAGWADTCRQHDGLVVAPHFPYPTGEQAADIVLNKIDAVEIRPGPPGNITPYFNSLNILDWYRYLNCGYRLPAVGGTDKMSAGMPVGGERAYVYLGQEEFTFDNWAKAVRRGNTFMSSGPLLVFQVDGHTPGDEIRLESGGGTVDIRAEANCNVPLNHLEVVLNGRVVASREDHMGSRKMAMQEKIRVPGPGWLAARCSSRLSIMASQWPLQVWAHTSPVYFSLPGQELFSVSAAAYMLKLIDGSLTWVENLATRPDPERFERIRKVFLDARARLHQRLHEHGIAH